MNGWSDCRNILCVRPDNMGDLLMSAPAIAALKEKFHCKISVLTSSMSKGIARYIAGIDEVLIWDVPWVKSNHAMQFDSTQELVKNLREKHFDAAVMFTVFSQNPLPMALVLSMAEIPQRLAYCRENPYRLLTHWIPDHEPYDLIRHQVRRDLDLVRCIGAHGAHEDIAILLSGDHTDAVRRKLMQAGADPEKPWLIIHPGVSELKREYPTDLWIAAGKRIVRELNYQAIITGIERERMLAEKIRSGIGAPAYNLAGSLTLDEYVALIKLSPLLISVNTGSVHLASAVKTPVIVLYALTNPQHPPWKSIGKALPFSVPQHLQSRNEVLGYVQRNIFTGKMKTVSPDEIFQAAFDLLVNKMTPAIPELIVA